MVDFKQLREQARNNKFADVVDNDELFPDTEPLADYKDQELVFLAVEYKNSKKYGEFAVITALPVDEDIVLHLRTTSTIVLAQLHAMTNGNLFPVTTTCIRDGQAWKLT